MNTTKSRRPFSANEDAYLRQHYPSLGPKRMSIDLKRHQGSIEKRARRLGLQCDRLKPLSEIHLAIVQTHYPTQGEAYCAQQIGRSIHSVRKAVRQLGLHKRIAASRREGTIDLSLFTDITRPDVAYLLGLLWTDGYVTSKRKGRSAHVSIGLKLTDWETIEPLVRGIGAFTFYKRAARIRASTSGGCYTGHNGLTDHLVAHDYHIKSTAAPTKILSTIPDHLKHYWWRGYVDGDGHISATSVGRYTITLAGSLTQDWVAAMHLLDSLGVRYVMKRRERFNALSGVMNRDSVIKITNREGFVKLGDYLYQGYEADHIGLPRKHDAYVAGLVIAERQRLKLLARSQPIAVYTKDWRHLQDYPSIEATANMLGIKAKAIREYFRFKRKWCKGYQFKRLPSPSA